jgi:hypothetical protein
MRHTPKSGPQRNIRRVVWPKPDGGSVTKCWQVTYRMKGLIPINAGIPWKKYGGEQKSLQFAMALRDAFEEEFAASDQVYGVRAVKGGFFDEGNSKGVMRYLAVDRNDVKKYPMWRASYYTDDGRRLYRNFLISKYRTDEEAREAAESFHLAEMIKYRLKKLRQESHRIRNQARGVTPVEDHRAPISLFLPPAEPEAKVWRYMDFTKFVWMFEQQGVFLSRIDKLDDPFEGSFSPVNQELRPLVRKHLHLTGSFSVTEIVEKLREWVGASCWHVSNHESAGMWKLYARTEEAVCIQTTYERLSAILPSDARIGMVRYVDYQKQWIPESNPLAPFMFKRLSFEHEQELRILKPMGDLAALQSKRNVPHNQAAGELIQCDLKQLIQAVHVAPNAPAWFVELVQRVVDRYWGSAIPVKRSRLADSPLW